MVDFRDVMIIDNSQDYENLVEKNNVLEKKNYFLGIIEGKEHLGLCPLNIDRLIQKTY